MNKLVMVILATLISTATFAKSMPKTKDCLPGVGSLLDYTINAGKAAADQVERLLNTVAERENKSVNAVALEACVKVNLANASLEKAICDRLESDMVKSMTAFEAAKKAIKTGSELSMGCDMNRDFASDFLWEIYNL